MKNVIVFGATGLVGGKLLQFLLEDDSIANIHVWGRGKMPEIKNDSKGKVKYRQINFDQLQNISFPSGVDACFCCLGTTMKKAGSKEAFAKVDYDYVKQIGVNAKAAHIPHFLVISAVDANVQSGFYYNRVKGKMEQMLLDIEFEHLSIFRPSLLLGKRKEFRFFEELSIKLMKIIGSLFVGKMKNYRMIKAKKVALAMLHSAKNPKGIQIIESAEMQKF